MLSTAVLGFSVTLRGEITPAPRELGNNRFIWLQKLTGYKAYFTHGTNDHQTHSRSLHVTANYPILRSAPQRCSACRESWARAPSCPISETLESLFGREALSASVRDEDYAQNCACEMAKRLWIWQFGAAHFIAKTPALCEAAHCARILSTCLLCGWGFSGRGQYLAGSGGVKHFLDTDSNACVHSGSSL